MIKSSKFFYRPLPHFLIGAVAMLFAWYVSGTTFRTSGVQFVTPVMVMVISHFAWAYFRRSLMPGFAALIMGRTFMTAIFVAGVFFLGQLVMPMPAQAASSEEIGTVIAMVIMCAVFVAVVGAVTAAIGYLLVKSIKRILSIFGGRSGPNSRLFDGGSLVLICALMGFVSLEGTSAGYAFNGEDQATAARHIDAPPDAVWRALQTATSPDFALPNILAGFPVPTKVVVDEGTQLGANRVVLFKGREGAGRLSLKVISQGGDKAVFQVMSDTTPYAQWIGLKELTFRVVADGSGARLFVTLRYDRKLSPAFVFQPMMRGAAYLGMDVLTRDVAARTIHAKE